MTDPPAYVADRPVTRVAARHALAADDRRDLLSTLLGSVRLHGERIADYAPEGTFSIGFGGTGTLHIIEQGNVELGLDDGDGMTVLARGDVVLLPRGDHHHLSDAPREDIPSPAPADHDRVRAGGPGHEPPRWLSGAFHIGDPQASHLLEGLPPLIALRGARGQSLEWFEVSRRMLLLEMQAPSQGSVVMIARILDLLFINALRHWASSSDAAPTWLTGAMDSQIGKALTAIHADPARRWTVEGLARACNLSRSAFAERFTALVGTSPARYLAEVRLAAAADLLGASTQPVDAVAATVGYTSKAAFSRAFSRHYGTPPARWRSSARGR